MVRGFAREDLFTVVLEHFLTDTADHADLVLPATTQLEHLDIHTSYGHCDVLFNEPAIEPLGEALPNTEVFRRLAAKMGFAEDCFRDSDEDIARAAFRRDIAWDTLKETGWQRLAVDASYAPFARGNFPTPSGRCQLATDALDAPDFIPPRESAATAPALARRYPLAFISPPARNFLNSSFANLPSFVDEERTPCLHIHPHDAAARMIEDGQRVRIRNDRGSFTASARVSDRARQGVVVAPSIWWQKLSPDGRNANAVTSQALTDMGRAATFYDCLVEVERE